MTSQHGSRPGRWSWAKAATIALSFGALVLALTPDAYAADLFIVRDVESQAEAVQTVAKGPVLRRRSVTIDIGTLAAMSNRPTSASSETFTLNLMPDVTVQVVKRDATVDELGNTVWRGVTVDGQGTATLVFRGGLVAGEVRVGSQTFGIAASATTANAAHTIVEYRQGGQWHHEDTVRAPGRQGTATHPTTQEPAPRRADATIEHPAATPAISIYIAYTALAVTKTPNMSGAISLAMADLRTTLANSQIAATVTLAGSMQTTYVELENESSDSLLNNAQIGAGDFARVRQAQQTAGADILSVWSFYEDNCGLAGGLFYEGNPALVPLAKAATDSVNTISSDCGADTFTHEVGHLFGADHERYIVDNAVPGPNGYNYGYTDPGHFRDVMAYGTECDDTNRPCPNIQYFSNPNLTYQGRPVGVADSLPAAADNSRKITEAAPYVAQLHTYFTPSSKPVLTIARTGHGVVTDVAGGLSCGVTCNTALNSGTRDTLTAVAEPGWDFAGWSGGCTGTALTCTVTVTASTTVNATFTASTVVQVGAIYSSTQPASQSFLRLFNSSTAAGTATVSLRDPTTGTVLGRWTSPSIAPGVERQFGISEIESGATPAIATKPSFYTVAIDAQFSGYAQHVLWHVSDNSLTNLTTCSSGSMVEATRLIGVHSTLLGAGYPSSIVVYNAGSQSATVTLGLYDAATATKLGTFQTDAITGNGGEKIYSVAAIEQAARIAPGASMYHYVVKAETALTGHIAHLMTNVQAGVVTDMSTVCPLRAPAVVSAASTLKQGAIFSSAQPGSQSFLRFFNTGTNFGTVIVSLTDPNTGRRLATWTSANITAGAEIQVPITTIEAAATTAFTKPDFYTVSIVGSMIGEFQHVLWHAADGTLTNLTTCTAGTHNNPWGLSAVHTSHIGGLGYPSSVIITNTGSTTTRVTLDIGDATDGSKLGRYRSASVPAGGQLIVPVTDLENSATPKIVAGDRSHYVITAADAFSGYLQHEVNNAQVGVITDMTATCSLQP